MNKYFVMRSLFCRRGVNVSKKLILHVALLTVMVTAGLLILQWNSLSPIRERISKELSASGQLEDEHENLVINRFLNDDVKAKKGIESLKRQIGDLKNLLQVKMLQLKDVEKLQKDGKFALVNIETYQDADKISSYLKNQVKNAYILKPQQYRNEYQISPFKLFTRSDLYNLETGLLKHPKLPVSFWQDIDADLKEVIKTASNLINNSTLEFVEGYYRTQHQVGTQFELVFHSTINKSEPLHLITLFRPFGPLHVVSSTVTKSMETVHIIVPLHGRGEAFRKFMVNFETAAIREDGHIHLTVVCYGNEALDEAKKVLNKTEEKTEFKSYQIIEGDKGGFARGRALQFGTKALPGKNPLMFFCDVDMFFTTHFLSQCRSQTKPGSKVFYPIVFSLYNPEIVYKGKQVPSIEVQQGIKRDNGFWRDFGFGMTCQYKDDFHDIGGFDLTIKGWGSEDVLLYRKYTRSNKYQVIRSPVDSLFHHWHPKHCDKALSLEQYNSCLRTKSLTEGSQIQLGMLYLQNKVESEKKIN